MKQRIITGIVLAIILIPAVIMGGLFFQGVIIAAYVISIYEMLHIVHNPEIKKYLYGIVACVFVYIYIQGNDMIFLSSYAFLLFMVVIFACCIFDDTLTLDRACYIFTMTLLVGNGIHMLDILRNDFGISYLLLLALATYGSDTGAYFTGVKFGKHKLIPRLSPKKTIEGSIGGIVLGTVLSLIFIFVFGLQSHILILLPACFVLTMTGQIGDLTFSLVKRYFGVKDYSNLLPGHGGILDRIDSLSFNAIIFAFFLIFVGL